MDLDHGEQLVRQGAFSAVDSIVEHGDVVDLQPVGGRDGFRFQPVDLVDKFALPVPSYVSFVPDCWFLNCVLMRKRLSTGSSEFLSKTLNI